jgi:Tol biopolymer transport system component
MTHHENEQLAGWLNEGPERGSAVVLERAFARVHTTRQRPAWVVDLTGGTIARDPGVPRLRFSPIVIVVAVVVLMAGAIIASGVLPPNPAPSPVLITSPSPSGSPDPSAPAAPDAGRIVYTRWTRLENGEGDCVSTAIGYCYRSSIFASNGDGSDERELIPGPRSEVLSVSADGSRLIFRAQQSGVEDEVYITDLNGAEPRVLDTSCQLPCVNDTQFAISPDGSRVAFVRSYFARSDGAEQEFSGDTTGSAIAIMDLTTGAVVELDSTLASEGDPADPCDSPCGDGSTEQPSWSPDGAHLLFSRTSIGVVNQPGAIPDTALFVVAADDSDFRQLVSTDLFALDARWSPDGTLIVFTSAVDTLVDDPVFEGMTNWQQLNDIYTVRPDGSGLQRLTTDTVEPPATADAGQFGARFPTWTRDGRIVFTRGGVQGIGQELWVMDGDGGNATQLDPTDAATLTAIGCTVCPYPPLEPGVGFPWPSYAFWVTPQ